MHTFFNIKEETFEYIDKNAKVLSFEDGKAVVKKADIAVEGEKISKIGKIKTDFDAQKVIDAKDMLAMPGLINTHTHLSMNLFRNYADDMPLWDWLTKKIWPLEEKLTAEAVFRGSILGIAELIKSGVTGFLDMYFFAEETIKAALETGVRVCIARGLTDEEEGKEIRLKETRELYRKYHQKGRIKILWVPMLLYLQPQYLESNCPFERTKQYSHTSFGNRKEWMKASKMGENSY